MSVEQMDDFLMKEVFSEFTSNPGEEFVVPFLFHISYKKSAKYCRFVSIQKFLLLTTKDVIWYH